jgi:D-arabinose 1-dehydrogenase-like Zn-dependent alcohol dehydrogenase
MNDSGGDAEVVGIEIEASQPNGAAVGRVDDAPETSAMLLGKRVLVGPFDPCGQCDICRRGGVAACAHVRRRSTAGERRVRAQARWLVALDGGLELPAPAAAAVAGDVAVAYTLYARTGLAPRDPVVITGETAVTRFLVEILIAKSIAPTVVAEPGPFADWLVGKGAVVARDVDSVAAALATLGMGARPARVLATDPMTLALACSLAGPRATLTVLAERELAPLPGALLAREVVILGVAGAHPDLVVEAAAMCAKGEIDLAGGTTTDPADHTRAQVRAITRA